MLGCFGAKRNPCVRPEGWTKVCQHGKTSAAQGLGFCFKRYFRKTMPGSIYEVFEIFLHKE
jgi:hypothetical protein